MSRSKESRYCVNRILSRKNSDDSVNNVQEDKKGETQKLGEGRVIKTETLKLEI